jgi:hypothetical protein
MANRCSICYLIALVGGLVFAPHSRAADQIQWLTGEPLQKALTQKAGVTWSNVPLRQSLTRFCESKKLAFVLDRRIDPDRKFELTVDDAPLEEVLLRIASRLDVGWAMVGPVSYFGPKPTVESIRTVAALRAQEAAKLPPAVRTTWGQLRPLKWSDATSPKDLLTTLGREHKFEIKGLNQVPHDLWAAADWPAVNLASRLTLILAQFDLSFEIAADGASISLVPFPADAKIEIAYNVPGSAEEIASGLRQNTLLVAAEINPTGNKIVVRARQEDHDAIKDLLARRPVKRTNVRENIKDVYTLKVTLAADKLLDQLAKKLSLELKIDHDAIAAKGLSLSQEVQLDVKQVNLDQLLRAVLDPVGLRFKRNGKVVEVMPK